jgi:hypothetical protein
MEFQVQSGSTGSQAVTHWNINQGFWCINKEQPYWPKIGCADFEVKFYVKLQSYDITDIFSKVAKWVKVVYSGCTFPHIGKRKWRDGVEETESFSLFNVESTHQNTTTFTDLTILKGVGVGNYAVFWSFQGQFLRNLVSERYPIFF